MLSVSKIPSLHTTYDWRDLISAEGGLIEKYGGS